MIYFRQLCDCVSRTYTYLIADRAAGVAALIDPVLGEIVLYLGLLEERQLRLAWVLETHVHADHITAAAELRRHTGARVAVGRNSGAEGADLLVGDRDEVPLGGEKLRVIATPGHTPGCVSYLWWDRVFTGDSLLIRGCGRTDLPGGNAGQLFDSVMRRLLSLPDETLVYPGHDYQGRWVSCMAEERATNPHLTGRTRDEFVALMSVPQPPKPAKMDTLLALNRRCGELNPSLAGETAFAALLDTLSPAPGADRWASEAIQCAAAPPMTPRQAPPN